MNKIKRADFCEADLKNGLVWRWCTDLYENEDSLVALPLEEEKLAEADTLLIRATFTTGSGCLLNGYVVFDFNEVFAVSIFLGKECFTFNKYAVDYAIKSLERLGEFLREDAKSLLPLKYSIVPKRLNVSDGEFTFETAL